MSPEETRKIVGDNIRLYRTELGMTQEELGSHLNVRNEHISRIENGLKEPSLPLLEKLSQILRHDVSDFFTKRSNGLLILLSIKFQIIEYLQEIEYVV